MLRLRALVAKVQALFAQNKANGEFDDELQDHLRLLTERFVRRGMSPKDAASAARCQFGNIALLQQRQRETRTFLSISIFWRDICFGARLLRKSPGFTAVAVLTLALGIGGNTAIFSIVNGVLLNPLPFPQPDRLVALHESKSNFENGSISYPNFLDWRKDNRTFSSMAVGRRWSFSLTGRGDAEQVKANFVSSGYFALLGVHPLLGREFIEAEDQPGASPVAMISEGLWRRKFSAIRDVLGQTITLDGKNFTIVGVIPAGLHLNIPGFRNQDVYAPIPQWGNSILMDRGAGLGFHGISRLKPGVTIEQARADMAEVTGNLAAAFPAADRGIGASLIPMKEQMVGNTRTFLEVLLAAVGFVLLIACVNVASLLLARSTARSREFGVRTALGASRGRVIRQLLTESLLLGIAAGALALFPAIWGTHAALKILPAALPRVEEIGLDFRA